MENTTVVGSILGVFGEVLEWFTTSLTQVGEIFYNDGLTFIGSITLVGLSIGIATMLVATIRSLLRQH